MQVLVDFLKNLVGIFASMKFPVDYLDIIILAILIYYVIKFANETRTSHLIKGVVVILALYQLAIFMNFSAITYILKNAIQLSFIAILIVFQPELRSGLERLGRVKFSNIKSFQMTDENDSAQDMVAAVCESCKILSSRKIGALFVFECSAKLGEIINTGFVVDAAITPQTLITIFFPNTPLHDGAVIIRNNRIASAGCLLPLSKNLELNRELGTRHRAALGITESSDALAVVVSEETGAISYAFNGKIHTGITENQLRLILEDKFSIKQKKLKQFKLFEKRGDR